METVRITVSQSHGGDFIKLTPPLKQWMGTQKKFTAFISGDNLVIKKTHSLADFAETPDANFIPIEEINREIHLSRNTRK